MPATFTNDFNAWQYGVPLISISGSAEFDEWSAPILPDGSGAVPVTDLDESFPLTAYQIVSVSSSSAIGVASAFGSATGISISMESARLTGTGKGVASNNSISLQSARLTGTGALAALNNSMSFGSASLTGLSPVTPTGIFIVSPQQPITRMPDYSLKFWQRRVSARQPTVRMP